MPAAATGAHTATFSTSDYNPSEAAGAFRELFARTIMHMNITPLSERFRAAAKISRWDDFGAIDVSSTASHQGNASELIVSGSVCFGWVRSSADPDDYWRASQMGRDVELHRGDGLIMSSGELGTVTMPSDSQYSVFTVSEALLKHLVPMDALIAHRIPADTKALQLLSRYLDLVQDERLLATPELQKVFTGHVVDLLALCIGTTRDATEIAKSRGVRAARLHAIKQDIQRSLSRSDLSVRLIAAWHGVTPRYVQTLFDDDGSTFTRFVLERRLDEAHRALADEKRRAIPISTIAYESGFTDLSNFNRAFRQRFGQTPTDVRAAAQARSSDPW
jgi:AraC-like DNA-binding protein